MHERIADGSGNGCVHGDADGGSAQCNDGDPGQQQQRGDGAGVGNGGGRSFERRVYGVGSGGDHGADRDGDGDGRRGFEDLLDAAERGGRGSESEHDECGVRNAGAEHCHYTAGDGDFVGDSGADDQRSFGYRFGVFCDGDQYAGDAESWEDGDADGGVRSDGSGSGERIGEDQQQRSERWDGHAERDRATGGEWGYVRQRIAHGNSNRCVYGDADRSGGQRSNGEFGEQQRRSDGTGVGDGGGGSFERGVYGDGRVGEHGTDSDADGDGGGSYRLFCVTAERGGRGSESEHDECGVRDRAAERSNDAVSHGDVVGDDGADDQRSCGEWGGIFRDGHDRAVDVESGADGDANGGVRSDCGGSGKRYGDCLLYTSRCV